MANAATKRTVVRLPREERIGDILAVAREVFSKRGYDGTAVSEIAERAGVVEGTVCKYFETKRELLLKAIESWYEGLVGDYSRDLAGITGTRQRLRFLIWRHLRTIRDDALLSRLMFSEVRSKDDYYHSPLHEMNRRYTQFLTDVVQEGITAGEFRSDIPIALIRDMVYGGIEHHTWSFLRGHGRLEIEAVADDLTQVVCDGLAARRPTDDLQRETERLSAVARRLERALDRKAKR